MSKLKDLPPAQVEIMDVLWERGEASVRDVHSEVSKRRKVAYKTVATLLMRLRDRGYVEAEVRNFAYVFRPLVLREQVVYRKLDDLVSRVLGGDLTPLALYMARHGGRLKPEQIALLEEIVRSEKEREGK
jgi:BlaI family penicillinase repressor